MLRWLVALCFAAAIVVAGVDLVASVIMEGAPRLQALGEWWAWVHRDSLLLLQPAIERHISPALWDPWVLTILTLPAAVDLAGLGVVLWLFGRVGRRWRRRRLRRSR